MKVRVSRISSSTDQCFEDVVNTFSHGNLYCIDVEDKMIKIPLHDIFDIVETYPDEESKEIVTQMLNEADKQERPNISDILSARVEGAK